MIPKKIIFLTSLLPNKVLHFFEFMIAAAQGKGYSESLKNEIKNTLSLVKNKNNISTILDIGANKGEYTENLLKYFPKSKYYLFEPSESNFKFLNQKFSDHKNIKIFKVALSDYNGNADLFSDEDGGGKASLTKRRLEHFNIDFNYSEEVEVVRLDTLLKQELNNDIVDYCKMDVEGHELSVLNGFGSLLKNFKVIQFEFGGCNIDNKTFFQDFWYFFKDKKFELFRISPSGPNKLNKYSELDECFRMTNYIAVNKNI